MNEFTPVGQWVKMTKSQMRRYLKEMEAKRLKAQLEIEKAKLRWEFDNDEDLEDLENKIDELL